MSKSNKRRASASGQYVSPLLNELEFLDEEPEEKPAAAKKKRPARKAAKKNTAKPKKSGPTAKINFDARAIPPQQAGRRGSAVPQPLLLLDKMKQPQTAKAWVKHLFEDLERRVASPEDDMIAEAIHSFRRGLDGVLKSGEELKLFAAPQRRPVVIDVAGTEVQGRVEEQTASPHGTQPAASVSGAAAVETIAEEDAAKPPSAAAGAGYGARELQQYGLIPYRFNVFDTWLELSISFAAPFAGEQYVLVATTNQPGCHTVVREKKADYAVVRLIRYGTSSLLEGELNWIALGEGASPPPRRQ